MVDIQGLKLLESCGFTWLFDAETHRFLRLPRDARVGYDSPSDWRPYHRLEIDSSRACFVVALDERSTHVLRAWLHQDPCGRCAGGRETVSDVRQDIQWWKERLRVVDGRMAVPRTRHPLRPYGGWPHPGGGA